jgi:prepilin-type N-terminal cleavage/methylation domain-containing protein
MYIKVKIFNSNISGGFTLIEILVVISIIGMLSSIVLSQVRLSRYKTNDSLRITQIDQVA